MKYWILSLGLLVLASGCERKVTSSNVQDQSGATASSKVDIGTHGTAPRPTDESGEAPAINNSPSESD